MRALAGVLLSLCLAVSAAGQERLGPDEMRTLAAQAANAGDAPLALEISDALLRRDPQDVTALLVRAHASREMGQIEAASDAAGRAWRAAETDEDRYAAALAKAQALSSGDQRTLAQLWLRRAAQVAPTDRHKAMAARDFRYVQSRNPLRVDLSFSVSPVSNINNGSKKATGTYELPFFGVVEAELRGAARALSGTEIRSGIALRYRLADRGAAGATDLHLIGSRRDYRLSDEAKRQAPGAEGSDFAFASTQVVLAHAGLLGSPRRPYRISGSLGRSWYGGAPYSQFADIAGSLTFALPENRAVVLQMGLRQEESLSKATADSHGWRAGIGWRQTLGEQGPLLSFDLEAARSFSENAAQDWERLSVDAGLRLAKPVLGMGLEFGLGAGLKRFEDGPVAGLGREDRSLEAEVTAEFGTFDFYGFVPRASIVARRTDSDFSQYDTEELGLHLGIRSAF